MQAADKKRPREEREILHRLRPFARLQTAEDYEAFATDMLCTLNIAAISARKWLNILASDEAILRKRIQELQHYRRLGLCTAADIDKYEHDLAKRVRTRCLYYLSSLHHSSPRHKSKLQLVIMTEASIVTVEDNPLDLILAALVWHPLVNPMTAILGNQHRGYLEQRLRLFVDLVSLVFQPKT